MYWWLASAAISSFLVFVETYQTFQIPLRWYKGIFRVYILLVIFALVNGAMASILYSIILVLDYPFLEAFPPLAKALLAGLSYNVLINFKFATIKSSDGKDIPLGIEYFYKLVKGIVDRGLNDSVKEIFYRAAEEEAKNRTLKELASQAKSYIALDNVSTPKEKDDSRRWILNVLEDENTSDEEKRISFAIFILSGKKVL